PPPRRTGGRAGGGIPRHRPFGVFPSRAREANGSAAVPGMAGGVLAVPALLVAAVTAAVVHGAVVDALLDVTAEPALQVLQHLLLADDDPLAADEVETAVVLGRVDPLALTAVGGEGGEDVLLLALLADRLADRVRVGLHVRVALRLGGQVLQAAGGGGRKVPLPVVAGPAARQRQCRHHAGQREHRSGQPHDVPPVLPATCRTEPRRGALRLRYG